MQTPRTICAEIPDTTLDSILHRRLHRIVKRCMIHGPCGVAKKTDVCMRGGSCSKQFPKKFTDTTSSTKDGYPLYRRRDNSRAVVEGGIKLDNRWVVPYNPCLLLKYNAHINIEICRTVSAVKYLYKYVYKGHDRAIIGFLTGEHSGTDHTKHVDEVSNYLEARYVSASEACYRIFAYELHANFPHVMRLTLHLENQQSVVFGDHSDIPDILSVEKHCTLTGWFVANLKFPSARSLSYLDFPESFVWDKTKREWKQRLKGHGTMIGRVYSAHPSVGERFYLRILLNHVTGCTSFQDIRTLPDGTLCHTFKEAACHRGLLEDDDEYDLCLAMAASWNMPPQLRHLFVTILLYNDPCNPAVLWEKYKYSFSYDFFHRARKSMPGIDADEHILNAALVDIDKRLQCHGKSLADFPGMPTPIHVKNPYDEALIIQQELDYDVHEQLLIVDRDVPSLNTEQHTIFTTIMSAVDDHKQYPEVSFIDGPGGIGKTFLYIHSWLRFDLRVKLR